jgi:hypothetical protein
MKIGISIDVDARQDIAPRQKLRYHLFRWLTVAKFFPSF